jgi:hypothetical protein
VEASIVSCYKEIQGTTIGRQVDDNDRPHTAIFMLQTLSKVKREAMEHPAHSADLVPSDFHVANPQQSEEGSHGTSSS